MLVMTSKALSSYPQERCILSGTLLAFFVSVLQVVDHFARVKKQDRLDYADNHFRPMSNFGGLRYIRYDFMAHVSSLGDDLEAILSSVGLWDYYGASGWGEDGNLSFKEAKGKNVRNHTSTQYYNKNLLRKVYQIYKEDYDRFGFSLEDYWNLGQNEE